LKSAGKEVNELTRISAWFSNISSETVSLVMRFKKLITVTAGQGLAEYALILALIAIVAIIALIFLGGQVSKILSNVGHSV
jgi:Flp pilus assembly pilin Flp